MANEIVVGAISPVGQQVRARQRVSDLNRECRRDRTLETYRPSVRLQAIGKHRKRMLFFLLNRHVLGSNG
jgi:hypothetical protein